MESVEYLMVGKETRLQIVVDKSLVQCLVDRGETYGRMFALTLSTLSKDILESLVLLGTVGQNK